MDIIFWNDYNIDEKEIIKYLKSNDYSKNKFIFEKLLSNSNQILNYIKYIEPNILKKLLKEDFKFINPNAKKNFDILRVSFLGENVKIKGLSWIVD